MKRLASAMFLAGIAFLVAAFWKQRQPAHEVLTPVSSSSTAPAAESEAPPLPPPEGPTLRIPDISDGSKPDASAPRYPLKEYLDRRQAEIDRWAAVSMELDHERALLSEILLDILRRYGLEAHADAMIENKEISIRIKDLAGNHALRLLIQQFGGEWVITEEGESWIVPRERAALLQPEIHGEVKKLETILAELAALAPDPQKAARTARTNELMDSIQLSLHFTGTPLPEAVSFMIEATELNIMIDRRNLADPESILITAKTEQTSLRTALSTVLAGTDVATYVDDGVIVLTSRTQARIREQAAALTASVREMRVAQEDEWMARLVTLPDETLSLRDVADLLSKATGTGYVFDSASWDRAARYGFDGKERSIADIAAILAQGAPVRLVYRDGRMWFLAASPPVKK